MNICQQFFHDGGILPHGLALRALHQRPDTAPDAIICQMSVIKRALSPVGLQVLLREDFEIKGLNVHAQGGSQMFEGDGT